MNNALDSELYPKAALCSALSFLIPSGARGRRKENFLGEKALVSPLANLSV
jgi:hypothetical protein